MFNFLKKTNKASMYAVANGNVIPIEKVGDGVFSEKMLGDGYAIQPNDSEVFAPVDGKIVSVFPTKHAMTIITENGLEILVHMGLDTVELKGVPFNVFVKEGDTIKQGTKLATMDLEELAKTNTNSTILVVVTNMDKVTTMPSIEEHAVSASEEIFTVEVK